MEKVFNVASQEFTAVKVGCAKLGDLLAVGAGCEAIIYRTEDGFMMYSTKSENKRDHIWQEITSPCCVWLNNHADDYFVRLVRDFPFGSADNKTLNGLCVLGDVLDVEFLKYHPLPQSLQGSTLNAN